MKQHETGFRNERLAYHTKRELARSDTSEYLSVIIDGAQSTKYPVLYPVPKNQQSTPLLSIGNYGLISHGREKIIKLLLPIFPTGSNLSLTVLYDYFRCLKLNNDLPPTGYVNKHVL